METQKTKQINLKDLNPLRMSDADMKFAEDEAVKLYQEDEKAFDKAKEVVNQLGIGGLWRGVDACILIVAKAIKGEK